MAVINGTSFNDDGTVQKGQIRPELRGGADPDVIFGNKGNDVLFAGGGDDLLLGGEGHDVMIGEAGNDQLFGATGDDQLLGGNGADRLFVSSGRDVLTGGNGADQFVFSLSQTDAPIITDFTAGVDTLAFGSFSPSGSNRNFALQSDELDPSDELSQGELDPSQFTVGEAAVDENTRFIYNNQAGELFYDSDGTGEQEQRLFAILESDPNTGLPPSLGSSDISITNEQPPFPIVEGPVFPPIGQEGGVLLPDLNGVSLL